MKFELVNFRRGLAGLRALRGLNGAPPESIGNGEDDGASSSGMRPWGDEQPLRSELFSIDQLDQHAKLLAEKHELDTGRGPDRLLPRLAENEAVLLRAYELVNAAVAINRRIAPAAEWLLDNFYLVEEQIRTARRHLPRDYSRELPRLGQGDTAGYPRVYDIALELISHVDGRVDVENLSCFVAAYQTVATLKLGELWAVPIMLRLALIENLRRVGARIAAGRSDRDRANHWADLLVEVSEKDPKNLVLTLADMVRDNPALTSAFVAEMARRLQGQSPALALAMTWIEQRLAENGLAVGQLVQIESQNQAADQVSIGNSIGSLRFLAAMDWREFVETHSAVEHTLRADPADVYADMDFATRDRYRHAIEKIARRSRLSESDVATEAIRLARETKGRNDLADRTDHVGYYLIDKGLHVLERRARMSKSISARLARLGRRIPLICFSGSIALLTAGICLLVWYAARSLHAPIWTLWVLLLPLILSASQLAVSIVNWLSTLLVTPHTLPRMDFSLGIPPDQRTAVVVPTMLASEQSIADLLESLEVRYLANRDEHLHFALLTDFLDAPNENQPEDEHLLRIAREGIESLNGKYADDRDDIFFLFHRSRRWNESQRCWMGWERKRGKLTEFNAVLRDGAEAQAKFSTIVGRTDVLPLVKYVITLDSDTQLPRDSARQLVGTMAHPLNRPRFDEKSGRVVDGYTILQPRVAITLPSAARSWFVRIFAGEPGVDPYTRAVSDVYQDVFGEGSFIGKGIYDVDAFQRALGRRFPENRILSHDLLEGSYARGALVSEVQLYEDYPSRFSADMSRRHRWIRGDWQIMAWLLPRVPAHASDGTSARNPISSLSRWKILDNLRRSLVPVAMALLLVLAWSLPGPGVVFTATILAIFLLPAILQIGAALLMKPKDLPASMHTGFVISAAGKQLAQAMFHLVFLPYDAYISLDAIVRTMSRVCITRCQLLEWQTASDAERNASAELRSFFASMWIAPILGAVMLVVLLSTRGITSAGALPILVLWIASPAVAWWLSLLIEPRPPRLSQSQMMFLRKLSRRTWRFFEVFVAPGDNFLPPDNYQEHPTDVIAHRTSPTNIGLGLLANLSAYDFGYLSAALLTDRTEKMLSTVEKLDRFHGHLFKWYDTRTLAPLPPRYVSTVDSGNLVGHLLTLRQGLLELESAPILPPRLFPGVEDTLAIALDQARGAVDRSQRGVIAAEVVTRMERLRSDLANAPAALTASRTLLQRIATLAGEFSTAVNRDSTGAVSSEFKWWADALERQVKDQLADLNHLAPWLALASPSERFWRTGSPEQIARLANLRDALQRLDEGPTLRDVAALRHTLVPTVDEIAAQLETPEACLSSLKQHLTDAAERASRRIADAQSLALRCEWLADIEWEFLFDKSRDLLSIGFNVSDNRLDASFYDLLGSEARLASYLGIAQGKLPQEHWFALGRLLTTSGREPALLSWSGSMFEYLMPQLVMPVYEKTLLAQTNRAVVHRQIEYGRQRGVPWGVSESGYNTTDAQLNYQYRAFGVPGLGFKRGLAEDLVVAPYATVMALMIEAESATKNLETLADLGQIGAYGFYEALDYTPSRVPRGHQFATVRSFMSHHQGMSLLSLAYLLLGQPMQRRFEADPQLRAADLLLQERVPKAAPVFPHAAEVAGARRTGEGDAGLRVFTSPHTPWPEAHLLSNGRYHVMVTAAGGGYSRWRDLAVTRWREDSTRDCWGSFVYLRDITTGDSWSTTHQPTLKSARTYEAIFPQARAEFRRRDSEIESYCEIAVSPEDDIELRRLTLTNRGRTRTTIEVTTFAEVVLAPPSSDAQHQAFSNLFVQTELLKARSAVICTRRARSASEKPPWMLHVMAVHATAATSEASFETDRSKFIGRGRDAQSPASLDAGVGDLSNSEGSVLDPIVAIRRRITLDPSESARVDIVTGMSETRDGAAALIEKYHDRRLADRVLELSWTHSQVVLRQLNATEAEAQIYGRLAANVLYATPARRTNSGIIARNRRGQSGLWGYGISGDLPIVLLRIADQAKLEIVRQAVQAHAYWRLKGLTVDLVIWNEDPSGYRQQLQDMILGMITAGTEAQFVDRPGGIFVRRVDQIAEEDKVLLQAVARVILTDSAGTLAEQIEKRPSTREHVGRFIPTRLRKTETVPVAVELLDRDLVYFNGTGGFTRDGREYVISTAPDRVTPAPWCNVLANANFGSVVTESGGGYTFAENAHEFRLTPWYNDPVSDTAGEAFYIRDEETGRFWSPAPLPARGPMPYTTRHGWGYSVFEYDENGIRSEMWQYVAVASSVKFISIRLRNTSGRPRRLAVSGFVEWVLGDLRPKTLMHVVSEIDTRTGALFARNSYNTEFPDRVAFFDCSETTRSVSGDRQEFIGRNGSLTNPAAMGRTKLAGRVGASMDPCAAMQTIIELADGQEKEVVFILGCGRDENEARTLVQRFRGVQNARRELDAVWNYWGRTLGTVNVVTPDPALNILANGWLQYQVLACRLWARSGFYQSGGAFGFRDQLQDVMSLLYAEPRLYREHILRCAAHQFRMGDVQHWWHPPTGRGVRTHFSDDYLWLPYAVCRYTLSTGDTGVLDEKSNYLEGRPVNPDEESYYDLPNRSDESGTLYDHCVRAIEYGLKFGEHGLPLMGCGDWNDGMNLVGEHGKGESVWLAFFLCDVLRQFSELAKKRGDTAFAERCTSELEKLRRNIETESWDGAWYRRAYFDNGEPLGSATNMECQIDSLPQSWAILSAVGDPARARQALAAVDARLVRRDAKLIQLFDPPFDKSPQNPGYIKGYVPGVRENGGQYTHAAVWTVMAFALAGDVERAWELWQIINPINHGDRVDKINTYKVEPYVVAADVYAVAPHTGRGGWTLYTGSAGWMYRMLMESFLGLRLTVDKLTFDPRVPPSWKEFTVHYRYRETVHHIVVKFEGAGRVVQRVTLDGAEQPDKAITMVDDRQEHHAEVFIG
ncbi:glucoamylase family protein [soil metagenome]